MVKKLLKRKVGERKRKKRGMSSATEIAAGPPSSGEAQTRKKKRPTFSAGECSHARSGMVQPVSRGRAARVVSNMYSS